MVLLVDKYSEKYYTCQLAIGIRLLEIQETNVGRLPFSVYDFFGYLACGFLLPAAADYTLDLGVPFSNGWSLPEGSLFVLIAYVAGQITAGLAAWLLERQLVHRCLGSPDIYLLQDINNCQRQLFPGFTAPLPEVTRKRVLEKARAAGIQEPGQALFLHAFARVKRDEITLTRLNGFLALYGFCRNMAFVFLLLAALFVWASAVGGKPVDGRWIAFSILGAIGMFWRYLKFFRQYAYEVFVTYSELT